MTKLYLVSIIAFCIVLSSCNPKVSTSILKKHSTLNYKQEVLVLQPQTPPPSNTEILGEIKIGDTGFTTNCDFETVIEKAKLEARKIGGNIVHITKHKPPTVMGSNCHRLKANILFAENIQELLRIYGEKVDSNANYSILKIYRPKGVGALINYDLYLNDSIICNVKTNFKYELKVFKEGNFTLWAKTETISKASINFKNGHTYFLNCSVIPGIMVGRPYLKTKSWSIGKAEYESFNPKHK